MTVVDFYTKDDMAMSPSSILNNEDVQYEIRKNETKYRDQIYKSLKTLYSDKSFELIDSLGKTSKQSSDIKKFVILNKLKSGKTKYSFNIRSSKTTSPFLELEKIQTTFYIDFDKLNNIILSAKSTINEDTFKYGNYLRTEYNFDKKWRIDYLIIVIFIILAITILIYYKKRIGTKNDNEFEDLVDKLNSDKEAIKQAQEILKDEEITKADVDKLKKLVSQIEENLVDYQYDSILDSLLYIDVAKAERKSLELYNRSTLMLILGLLIAVVGVLVFYFTLPEFKKTSSAVDYLALTIRPTLLLLFVQSISFYLLRQYRSLINDYKYFYEEYLKKSKTFITYQLIQNDELSEVELKLIDNLLQHDRKNPENVVESDEPLKGQILDVVKTLIEKFK